MQITENEKRLFEEKAPDADLLSDENFDYETCGARLLGRDIANLLNAETKKIVINTVSEENGGKLQLFADVIYGSGLLDEEMREKILKLLTELRRGIEERI